MAKSRGGKSAVVTGTPLTPAQEMNRRDWARRHPQRAIDERGLRKARVQMLDRWGHKNAGTAETHEAHSQQRPGAIARLHASGYLNDDELAWSQEIATAAARIMADALVRTASMETRVDGGNRRNGGAFFEALGAVWGEMAYSRWRALLGARAAIVLDVVVHDIGLARAAQAHGMHARRARRLLTDALLLWAGIHRAVRDEVSAADLAAAQAAIL